MPASKGTLAAAGGTAAAAGSDGTAAGGALEGKRVLGAAPPPPVGSAGHQPGVDRESSGGGSGRGNGNETGAARGVPANDAGVLQLD